MEAAGVASAHLVGHSLGATVALLVAARHPARVRRVAVAGAATHADGYIQATLDLWDSLAGSDLPLQVLHQAVVLATFGRSSFDRIAPAVLKDLGRHPLDRSLIARYIACDREQDLRPHLGRVDAPLLSIAGAEDALCGVAGARAIAEMVPGAQVGVIAGAGHSVHMERGGDFARAVAAHLAGGAANR